MTTMTIWLLIAVVSQCSSYGACGITLKVEQFPTQADCVHVREALIKGNSTTDVRRDPPVYHCIQGNVVR